MKKVIIIGASGSLAGYVIEVQKQNELLCFFETKAGFVKAITQIQP
jgi:hypothetical protein